MAWLSGSMMLTLCSLLSKESGLTVTALCVVYDYFILHRVSACMHTSNTCGYKPMHTLWCITISWLTYNADHFLQVHVCLKVNYLQACLYAV